MTGGTTAACNSAVENQLQAAGLVANGTTASGSAGTWTLGSYTVTYKDNGTLLAGDVSTVTTGDTLTVTISATWGTVGAGFRPAAIIGSSKTISTASAMRVEG